MNIDIFGKAIPLYGIFFWLGIFAAAVCGIFICKKKRLPLFDLTGSAVYTIIGAMIGAKFLYLAISLNDIIEYAQANSLGFWELLPMIIKGGFVFYGGLAGGLVGLIIYAKQFKMDSWLLIDIYSSVVPLGHAIGRIGCFFGGCCYGIEYNGPFHHVYTTASGNAPIGIPLFPVQLFEMMCLLILFAVQMFLLVRFSAKKRILVYNYAVSYSLIRLVVEFLRGDYERGIFLFLSTSQWISLILCAIITAIIIYQHYKSKEVEKKIKNE